MHERVLWWVKRDARLHDNEAFTLACQNSKSVLPLFVFEPLLLRGPDWGPVHTHAVLASLDSLRKNLHHHGLDLWVRQGAILTELEALHRSYAFTAIYAHQEVGLNHTYARDQAVVAWCQDKNIEFIEVSQNGIRRGSNNRDSWQKSFQAVLEDQVLPIPSLLGQHRPPTSVPIGRMPSLKKLGVTHKFKNFPDFGERAAALTLRSFLYTRGHAYSGGISSMLTAPTACSRLSVHLAWGTLSLRQAWQAAQKRLANHEPVESSRWQISLPKFQSRLYWHAHFVQKLETEVSLEFYPASGVFQDTLPVVRGDECEKRLTAWREGKTGFPMIDAAMRYYHEYGWLNFRSRAMVTSFAVHALRIPWQTIQYELAKFMVDYVPGINTTQVQMQTGVTGINTIRVYSPSKQMTDHDPEARFIRSIIPELASFRANEITAFATTDLGTYPKPIIDFKAETKIMKDALYALKKSPTSHSVAKAVYQKHGSRKRGKS